MRRLLAILWLALAVAIGQHAASVHALKHATDALAGTTQAPQECEQHSLLSSLGSAAGSDSRAAPAMESASPAPVAPHAERVALPVRYSFLSRAPPASPA